MLEPDLNGSSVGVVSHLPVEKLMLVWDHHPSSGTWAAGVPTPGGRTAQSGDGTNEGWSEGSFGVSSVFLGLRDGNGRGRFTSFLWAQTLEGNTLWE